MENINYIKDGEYLTGYKDENDVGVLNRPVYELQKKVNNITEYLKSKGVKVKEDDTFQWASTNW